MGFFRRWWLLQIVLGNQNLAKLKLKEYSGIWSLFALGRRSRELSTYSKSFFCRFSKDRIRYPLGSLLKMKSRHRRKSDAGFLSVVTSTTTEWLYKILRILYNEVRGGAVASCRTGLPAVILTKLRFEN